MAVVTLRKLIFILLCSSIVSWMLMQAYVTSHKRTNSAVYIKQLQNRKIKFDKTIDLVNQEDKLIINSTFHNEESDKENETLTTAVVQNENNDLYNVQKEIRNIYTTNKSPQLLQTTNKNEETTTSIITTTDVVANSMDAKVIETTEVWKEAHPVQVQVQHVDGMLLDKSFCPTMPEGLIGPLKVDSTYGPTIEEAITVAGNQVNMGCYKPMSCHAKQRVAIVIPFKNRQQHLITLSHHIHPILQRQMLHYCVFVAEQFDNGIFNKASIMNAAFLEIYKIKDPVFDCVVFHDVDMLTENDMNLYSCSGQPKHMSIAIDKFNYTLGYGTEYGGVTAMSVKHYFLLNGHSNDFWGWGGEDNDMENRIRQKGLHIHKVDSEIGRFKMIKHSYPWWFSPLNGIGSWLQWKRLRTQINDKHTSGLSTLKYTLVGTKQEKLWTKFTFDIRTLVMENVVTHFTGKPNDDIVLQSRAVNTEAVIYKEDCYYVRYTGVNVNKTMGLQERTTYGRTHNYTEAMDLCTEMETFCQSVVEEFPGKFSLRSKPYMKNNTMTYMANILHQQRITEIHHTRSVHVKVCPKDTSYVSILRTPYVMNGDENMGSSPSFDIDFKIRLYNPSNSILTFTADINTVHKTTQQYKLDSGLEEYVQHTSMGEKNFIKKMLITLNDTEALKRASVHDVIDPIADLNRGKSLLLDIKTPKFGLLRMPGFYVAKCMVVNEVGTTIIEWELWFEIRAKNKEVAEKIQEKAFKRYGQHSVALEKQMKIDPDNAFKKPFNKF